MRNIFESIRVKMSVKTRNPEHEKARKELTALYNKYKPDVIRINSFDFESAEEAFKAMKIILTSFNEMMDRKKKKACPQK